MIMYKVIHLPITHDETSTTVHYSNFSYWQIMMYPDEWPNNHILNTLMSKFLISILGAEQWVVRLPNLLSFLLYAFAIFRTNKTILGFTSRFFIPASILFICNPYLLDFFGLCRGYAMSCALATLSVSYMITGYKKMDISHVWISFFLSILASYANFTLLVFWVAVSSITFLFFFIRYRDSNRNFWKPSIILFISCISYAALIATPIIKMQSTNQFQYWEQTGFYEGTIVPLVIHALYGSSKFTTKVYHFISITAILVILWNTTYVIYVFFKTKFNNEILRKPIFVATSILLITAFVNIIQCLILKTPNLNGRTALFFFPLFILALITTIGTFKILKNNLVKSATSLFVTILLILQLADTFSFTYVREWWFDANTFQVVDYLNKPNKKVTLKTNWLFYPSFYFYKYTGKLPNIDLKEYDKNIDINTDAEYYYINKEDFKTLESKFELAFQVNEERMLVKRKKTSQ